jgi:hypothetical protein
MARFWRREVSKVAFVATLTSQTSPTVTEINAGTDLTAALADISGFEIDSSTIPTPDLATAFTPSVPGEDTAKDPRIVFWDDNLSSTVRTALAKGTAGFIVLMPYGKTATKRCEVWAVTTTGYNDEYSTGNEAAKAHCSFAVTAVPKQSSTLA